LLPAAVEARSFYTTGAGGVPLAVGEVGPADGPEILFLHGLGQGRESFRPQFESNLSSKYHLVAFDLRGHGMSGKPWDEAAYTTSAVWAEDVARVMAATGLRHPILVGWSYGTGVAADYVREHGGKAISGLMLISALGGFVQSPPPAGLAPADLVRSRELRASVDLLDQQEAQRLLIPFLTGGAVSARWRQSALALGTLVPPYVDSLLRKHKMANQDLVPGLKLPVMIVHGRLDEALAQNTVDVFLAQVPGAKASRYDTSGHSPFAEDTTRFNRELAAFVDRVWRRKPE
jgi:pimeloyl-ACP methyl ester carboxylesterase